MAVQPTRTTKREAAAKAAQRERYLKRIKNVRTNAREDVNKYAGDLNRLPKRILSLTEQLKALEGLKGGKGKVADSAIYRKKAANVAGKLENAVGNYELRKTSQDQALKKGQQDLVTNAITDPNKIYKKADVAKIDVKDNQIVDNNVANAKNPALGSAKTVKNTATATPVNKPKTGRVTAAESQNKVERANKGAEAAQGTVSDEAIIDPAQGTVSDESLADSATMDPNRIQEVDAGTREVQDNELVDAATDYEGADLDVQEADQVEVDAAQGQVQDEELVKAKTIAEADMAQAEAVTADELDPAAKAQAVIGEKFTVDDGTLAAFQEGSIEAMDTVQGQLAKLMQDFDNGAVPGWAAGSIRAANDAMAARGLGGSSLAGAAIIQATMESAIPIANADAQAYREMKLNNLNRQTQVALANAAAQQGLSLQNLDNQQRVELQNSLAAGQLQQQNLSAQNAAVIANAQIKAALQGQNLSAENQAGILNAARYAESANINLNNAQQSLITASTLNSNIDLANLSTRTQQAIAEAQVNAALEGKVLDNKQQAAIVNATRFAEANDLTFTAEQNAALHNSTMMQTIGLAELSAKNTAILQNAATYANMDMANLDNRQQALVENSKAFLAMDMSNLTNRQQMQMFKQQSLVQSIFSDQAAKNVAKNLNFTEKNDANQFFANLKTSVRLANAAQKNAMKQFNTSEVNDWKAFKKELRSTIDMFNQTNQLAIQQFNATWRRDVSTLNTAAENLAIRDQTLAAYGTTASALDNLWQRERDIMAFAFQAAENQYDRDLQLYLGDKEFAEYDKQRDEREEAGKGALEGYIVRKATDALFDGGFW